MTDPNRLPWAIKLRCIAMVLVGGVIMFTFQSSPAGQFVGCIIMVGGLLYALVASAHHRRKMVH